MMSAICSCDCPCGRQQSCGLVTRQWQCHSFRGSSGDVGSCNATHASDYNCAILVRQDAEGDHTTETESRPAKKTSGDNEYLLSPS